MKSHCGNADHVYVTIIIICFILQLVKDNQSFAVRLQLALF